MCPPASALVRSTITSAQVTCRLPNSGELGKYFALSPCITYSVAGGISRHSVCNEAPQHKLSSVYWPTTVWLYMSVTQAVSMTSCPPSSPSRLVLQYKLSRASTMTSYCNSVTWPFTGLWRNALDARHSAMYLHIRTACLTDRLTGWRASWLVGCLTARQHGKVNLCQWI